MSAESDALRRTTALVNQELFAGKADQGHISDGLISGKARLRADRAALESRGGQSALITAFMLIARLGMKIDLDLPAVPVIDQVAPLRRTLLPDALLDLGGDLIRRQTAADGDLPDVEFAIGTPSSSEIGVSVDDFSFSVGPRTCGTSCKGVLPLGGLAAGATIAAIAFDAVIPKIEAATGLAAHQPRPLTGPPAALDLRDLFPGLSSNLALPLGSVDVISGGAITNALVYCFLRLPGLDATLRIIDSDPAEISNLNRYALLRTSQLGHSKVKLLEGAAAEGLTIEGIDSLFKPETREALEPLADRVVVGADDVEARWWAQQSEPAFLVVGATSNHLVQLTTHLPGTPCAGCLHPVPLPPQEIPTISFVSFWAGLLQACALLASKPTPLNVSVHPFALGGTVPVISTTPRAATACPVGCPASTTYGR